MNALIDNHQAFNSSKRISEAKDVGNKMRISRYIKYKPGYPGQNFKSSYYDCISYDIIPIIELNNKTFEK